MRDYISSYIFLYMADEKKILVPPRIKFNESEEQGGKLSPYFFAQLLLSFA